MSFVPKEKRSAAEKKWIQTKLKFLQRQGEEDFSFNYWIRSSKLNKSYPLPDDIDDTAFALGALYKHGIEIDERYFLKAVSLESKPGGPYRTWYTNIKKKEWRDVDPAVNASFLYFASLYGISLKGGEKFIKDSFQKSKIKSVYYPSEITFLFYCSKYVKESEDEKVRELLVKRLKKNKFEKLDHMERLQYLLSQSYLGIKTNKNHLALVIKLQKKDGSLPALPFSYDYMSKGKQTFSGSSVMSTALYLELLLLVTNEKKESKITNLPKDVPIAIGRQKKVIKRELSKLGLLKKPEKFLGGGTHKALSTPSSLALSLKKKLSSSEWELVDYLSIATFFAWEGYTILDDVLDGQESKENIYSATSLINLAWKYYYKVIGLFPGFESEILLAFNTTDRTYEWEYHYTKFDRENLSKIVKYNWNYDYIEKRMQPFLIAMKYVPLFLGNRKITSERVYQVFKAKMIIDQLNDDAHDWEEDKKLGIMTYVLWLIYKRSKDSKRHKMIFWRKAIFDVIRICKKEYVEAKRVIKLMNLENDLFSKMLDKSYSPIVSLQEEIKKTKRLLRNIKAFN